MYILYSTNSLLLMNRKIITSKYSTYKYLTETTITLSNERVNGTKCPAARLQVSK